MNRTRLSSLVTVATVLLLAWVASRVRLDLGIAIALGGLLLAYARGMLALPAAAIATAAVWAPIPVAAIAVFLGLLYGFVSILLSWGGAPTSGRIHGSGFGSGFGFGDGGGGGDGGGDCGGW